MLEYFRRFKLNTYPLSVSFSPSIVFLLACCNFTLPLSLKFIRLFLCSKLFFLGIENSSMVLWRSRLSYRLWVSALSFWVDINLSKLFLLSNQLMIPFWQLFCFSQSKRFKIKALRRVTAYISGRPFTILRLLGFLLCLNAETGSVCSLIAVMVLLQAGATGSFSFPNLVVCQSINLLAWLFSSSKLDSGWPYGCTWLSAYLASLILLAWSTCWWQLAWLLACCSMRCFFCRLSCCLWCAKEEVRRREAPRWRCFSRGWFMWEWMAQQFSSYCADILYQFYAEIQKLLLANQKSAHSCLGLVMLVSPISRYLRNWSRLSQYLVVSSRVFCCWKYAPTMLEGMKNHPRPIRMRAFLDWQFLKRYILR